MLPVLLAVGALVLYAYSQSQNSSSGDDSGPSGDDSTVTQTSASPDNNAPPAPDSAGSSDLTAPNDTQAISLTQALASTGDNSAVNRQAWLAMIRYSEGTDKYGNPYQILFGGTDGSKYGYANHPAFLGWSGVQLKTGHTTAAGAYQFEKSTWSGLNFPDYTPDSQDAACLALTAQCGQLDNVDSGNIQTAIGNLGNIWASFPSGPSNQGHKTMDDLLNVFTSNGGVLSGS